MAIKPVAIPVSAEEVKLIQRRQATLVMQMNKIDEAVRSGKYSKAEGENRKMFLKSEVADLDYLKSQRRAPPSTPFRPAPKPSPPRSKTGQSSKYNSTATSGQTKVGKGTKVYSTNTKSVNTGKAKKLTIRDIPKNIGKNYGSKISSSDAKSAGGYFYEYQYTGKYKYTVYYGAVNPSGEAVTKFRDWNRIHLGKEYTKYVRPPRTSTKSQSATQKPKEAQSKNPYGKGYGSTFGGEDRARTGGWYAIYNGQFYGPHGTATIPPRSSNTGYPKRYGAKIITAAKSSQIEKWKKWNSARGIRYGKATKTIRVSDFTKKSSSTRSSSSSSTRSSYKPSQTSNPFGKNYLATFSSGDIDDARGWFVLEKGNFYGPRKGSTKFVSNVTLWKKWNDDRGIKYGRTNKKIKAESYRSPEEAIRDAAKSVSDAASRAASAAKSAFSKVNPFGGRPPHLIHRDTVKLRREATLVKARRGARLDINKAGKRKAPNWQSIANTQEKQMIQQALTMVGLTEMPKLTERGNEVLVKAIRTNRIDNPQKKMEVGARRMGRVLTELINNSGYFAVKYKAKVSPTFPPQVQLSEMAGIAGGFSKTRNSMQRLLRK